MSHFTVAVFTDSFTSVDELLAPYEEGTNDPMYLEWVTADESIEEITAKFNEKNDGSEDLKQFVKRWYGYDYNLTYKNFGRICNPNAKWDWYMVGGRWGGLLKLKNAEGVGKVVERCDTARVRDCDFSPNEEDYRKAIRLWEIAVEGSPMTEEERKKYVVRYKGEYYIQKYGTKENYARQMSDFYTYAFITADGEWHETGSMGWFGMDDATRSSREAYRKAFDAYLEEARKQDLLITIVDCHI